MHEAARYCTPPQLAKRWNCTPETVLALIRRGALKAFTLSPPGCKRPRWRINPEAVADFERVHSHQAPHLPVRRQRQQRDPSYVEYFK